jgi:TrmH family RNA methyltransferase
MPVFQLASKTNPVIKLFRAVITRAQRAPADLVLAEGIRILEEANRSGCLIEAAIVSDRFGQMTREQALLDVWTARDAKIYRTTEKVLGSISDVRTSQGAMALVRLPLAILENQSASRPPLIVCACNIQDPGNLGTLIRSALGAGVTMIVTTPGTVSARGSKTVRASAGAVFHIPITEEVTPERFREYCQSRKIHLYRTAARAGLPYFSVDLRGGVALLLGNEARGTADETWPEAESLHIPMSQEVESLNVAAAGAVLLFEAHRQRSLRPNAGGS